MINGPSGHGARLSVQVNRNTQFEFVNDRQAPDTESQPSVELRHWRILLRGNGDLHLTAQLDSGALRVTSKLQYMELASGAVRTESGRSYQLCAPPEGDKVLRGLMRLRALRDLQMISGDVSDVIWAAIAAGAWPEGKKAMLPAA